MPQTETANKAGLRVRLALCLDLLTVVVVFVSLCLLRFRGEAFIYFTTDSNILAAIACILTAGYRVRALSRPGSAIPLPVRILRFTGSVAVAITFLTVLCFLGPKYGFGGMYAGANLPLHLFAPLTCVAATLIGDDAALPRLAHSLFGAVPVVLYGTLYAVFVLSDRMPDIYGFNADGRWYFTMPGFFFAAVIVSLGLFCLSRLCQKKRGQ